MLLKNQLTKPCSDSPRMITFVLGSSKEKLNLTSDDVLKIKIHDDKDVYLTQIFNSTDDELYISGDEEKIETYPDDFLMAMSRLNDAQLLESFEKKVITSKVDTIFNGVKTQKKIRNSAFKLKLHKKDQGKHSMDWKAWSGFRKPYNIPR